MTLLEELNRQKKERETCVCIMCDGDRMVITAPGKVAICPDCYGAGVRKQQYHPNEDRQSKPNGHRCNQLV